MNKKPLILAIIVILAIAAGVYFWKFYKKPELPTPVPSVKTEEPQSLGGSISEQVQNPAEKLPQTNPFKEIKTNPFEGKETNPFKDVYKNPFQ
jgi:flagellar basal body-associated protein FliL